MKLRILLVDNHRRMRENLRAILAKIPGMEVVTEAQNGHMAIKLARELKPDVIIMDINMPDLNGIDVTCRIVSDCPCAKIIGLSMYSDCQFVEGMLKAGACGYLLKDCAFEELAGAIHSVVANQTYLGSGIAGMDGFAPA